MAYTHTYLHGVRGRLDHGVDADRASPNGLTGISEVTRQGDVHAQLHNRSRDAVLREADRADRGVGDLDPERLVEDGIETQVHLLHAVPQLGQDARLLGQCCVALEELLLLVSQ